MLCNHYSLDQASDIAVKMYSACADFAYSERMYYESAQSELYLFKEAWLELYPRLTTLEIMQ